MRKPFVVLAVAALALGGWPQDGRTSHPRLLLTAGDVANITATMQESPGFMRSLELTRARVDRYFASGPDVPAPTDAGGGYSHEQHKRNGVAIREAGIVYQLTGDGRYADHARSLLLAYADLYPDLDEHPMKKEQTPGRLFWQSLNESVWLVHAIQGYDAIVDTLSGDEKSVIEERLLRPMADFLSVESPQTFDRIHNHGTWAVAAVGMTGYTLDDPSYVEMSLYGLNGDGKAGFIRQLDLLLSPDGYYAEGPYYQRYALMPLVVFARSIENNDPELKIFEYREGILLKAIHACIELSYGGLFFPINDAIREKGLDTVELRHGVAIAYALTGDPRLLSVASRQESYVLTGDGFEAALAADRGEAEPYEHRSVLLRDGPSGEQGGLAVLRNGAGPGHQALVFKATAQGMGHGHFDKLHWIFYDNGNEIVADYGAARFLNIEPKNGGRYLPENESWAKQTVAHNTLVVDGESHFGARLAVGERFHPEVLHFGSDNDIHVAAASMDGAYEGVSFSRTLVLADGALADGPVVVDVLDVTGAGARQYDLPVHFKGQVITTNPPLRAMTERLLPLGSANGYQHLWLRAETEVAGGELFSMTWLAGNRFYTYSIQTEEPLEVLFAELGANDPQINLRREQAVILRMRSSGESTFVSTLEVHGEYDAAEESTIGSEGSIAAIEHFGDGHNQLVKIVSRQRGERYLTLSYDPDDDLEHAIRVAGREFVWSGFFGLFDRNGPLVSKHSN
ncbi:MAG: alginate lyase family protein [Gammaproteobacteria bacterium]|nr:alginate lyase family protein [Gammaproteobacteria bacterium]MYH34290.1 alginate lyase family protein [Gammaproteobacteria bacterium]